MTVRRAMFWVGSWFCCAAAGVAATGGEAVRESARSIPVAYQVDVVVVGASTGGVAAAVQAAKAGAKVFLAAERPYLGDDMTATLRLWQEPGDELDSPLARKIFNDPQSAAAAGPRGVPFQYAADRQNAAKHRDTNPPSRLNGGKWGDPVTQSVQYDENVNIVADLGQPRELSGVRVMAYLLESSDAKTGYKVGKVTAFTGDDRKTWRKAGAVEHSQAEAGDCGVTFFVPLATKARYVKLDVEKAANASRMLLGQIEIAGTETTAPAKQTVSPPRPMHVKKTLDDALLAAGVQYLYSCYPTDVLRDRQGRPCGIVMANRAGRQAVIAKTIIDATPRAAVARMAGAAFRPYPAGEQTMKYTVIGGKLQTGERLTGRIAAPAFHGPFPNRARTSSSDFAVCEYTLKISMPGDTDSAWAAAEQLARSKTYDPEQQFTADALYQVPPDPLQGEASSAAAWRKAEDVPLAALRPAGVAGLYVLGPCADVSREAAEHLMQPGALIALGMRVGKAAAEESRKVPVPRGAHLPGSEVDQPAAQGEVREMLAGVRSVHAQATVPQEARGLPVLGRYDVVVIGGGTSGAPAGIAAARRGAKTLVVEHLHGLGGVGTMGAISKYYWGNRVGFTASVPGEDSWVIEQKMEWWRSELLKAGGELWFGCIGCGALVDDGHVCGVVVVTPRGRGLVLAKAVIDTTGNADIAAAAGAECTYTDESEFAMQGTGLPPRNLGATYANTDFDITDETDLVDVWHLFVYSKGKFPTAFDQGKLVDTRERRRIVGDHALTMIDEVNGRTYPDTIEIAYSNYDTHGYTVDPYLLLEHPEKRGVRVNVPYRCCLPKGLEGILVGGLGISAHRDALPLVRMQPDMQNLGYALGVAAATGAKSGRLMRSIDIRDLQRHLVEIGNLPERVLKDGDSYPMPADTLAKAVASVKDEFHGAAVLLAQPEQSLPLLRAAYSQASGKDKIAYAEVLGVMGDAAGVDTLIEVVRGIPQWDRGWNYQGMGQFGRALSDLDGYIIALGRTHDRRAVPVILEKLRLLGAGDAFSHHRAVGLALETIGDPSAAKALAELLAKPGMTGYVHATIDVSRQHGGSTSDTNTVQSRRESLRELLLARALYRCGDYEGQGEKILRQYVDDLRGHLSRHAQAVLKKGP